MTNVGKENERENERERESGTLWGVDKVVGKAVEFEEQILRNTHSLVFVQVCTESEKREERDLK